MNSNSHSTSCLGRSFAWLLSGVLFICLFLSLFSISAQSVILNPDTYINSLEEQQLYSAIPEIVMNFALKNIQPQDPTQITSALITEALMKSFIEQLIPLDWAKSQTNQIIQSLMDFVNLRTDELILNIDLVPIKSRVTPEFTRQFLGNLFNNLPACTADQLIRLEGMFLGLPQGSESIFLCNPPAVILDLANLYLNSKISDAFATLPDQLPLLEKTGMNPGKSIRSSQYFVYYEILRKIMQFLPLIDLFLVGMLVVLFWRDRRTFFNTIGVLLIVVGLSFGLFAYITNQLLPDWIMANISATINSMGSVDINQKISFIIQGIGLEFRKISWISAAAAMVLGFVLILISRLFTAHDQVNLKRF